MRVEKVQTPALFSTPALACKVVHSVQSVLIIARMRREVRLGSPPVGARSVSAGSLQLPCPRDAIGSCALFMADLLARQSGTQYNFPPFLARGGGGVQCGKRMRSRTNCRREARGLLVL